MICRRLAEVIMTTFSLDATVTNILIDGLAQNRFIAGRRATGELVFASRRNVPDWILINAVDPSAAIAELRAQQAIGQAPICVN